MGRIIMLLVITVFFAYWAGVYYRSKPSQPAVVAEQQAAPLHDGNVAGGYYTGGGDAPPAEAAEESVMAAEPEQEPLGRAKPYRALGQEPGWLLEMDAEQLVLQTRYGEVEYTAETPQAQETDVALQYDVTQGVEQAFTIIITPQRCADSMSGMLYPDTVTVTFEDEELRGCGGDSAGLLTGGEWHVEAITGEDVIADSRTSLQFSEEGRVYGNSGCNRYNAGFELSGEGLRFQPAAATKMACEETAMQQEQRFFSTLETITRFDMTEDGALLLLSGDTEVIRASR